MIKVLDDKTINKIAAGEVVERPAAVIRELVENAIDAKADDIYIELEAGGKRLIRIRDNGIGMSREDATLCLQRHATSKIRSEADLFSVTSLGFRGEAIPSIAAVSRFELLTKTKDNAVGTKVMVDGGSLVDITDAGCPKGTQITSSNLFFNVPARKKFLRTDSTELAHCLETVVREALIRPHIGFEVRHNRSTVISAPKTDTLLQRAVQLLGNVGRSLVQISLAEKAITITGLVSPVGVHRATSQNNTYIYVNGRFVKDTSIRRSIREAYQGLVPKGRYPSVVLCIQMPPSDVDVNVHPAKTEVRFRFVKELSSFIVNGIRSALQEHGIKKETQIRPKTPAIPPTLSQSRFQFPVNPSPSVRRNMQSQFDTSSRMGRRIELSSDSTINPTVRPFFTTPQTTDLVVEDSANLLPTTSDLQSTDEEPRAFPPQFAGIVAGQPQFMPAPIVEENPPNPLDPYVEAWPNSEEVPVALDSLLPVDRFAELRVLGQLNETYILCEGRGELVIIDQHAAHERITLYELMKNAQSQIGSVQRLLSPIIIELAAQRFHALSNQLSILGEYGLELEVFGSSSLMLRQVPQSLMGLDFQKLIEDVADDVAMGGRGMPIHQKVQHILATRACHSSIRAGDILSPFRMHELLEELDEVDFGVCAHGRPVAIRITPNELERRFHRS